MSFISIETPTLIIWMSSLAAILSVAAVALPFLLKGQKSSRMKLVSKKRDELSKQQLDKLSQGGSSIRQKQKSTRVEMMKKVLEKLNLDEALSSKHLKMELQQAGYRQQNALIVFLFSRLAGAVGGGLLTMMVLANLQDFSHPLFVKLLIIGGGGVVGFFLPKVLISNAAQKRRQEINVGFADALDLMVICVEGGLSVENAFERVTEEISENFPTLAQEFGLTSAELAYLGDRHKAYMNFAERTGLDAIKSLATTLVQSERYGTPVGQALKVLSQERRGNRMAIAEKKGAALPAKLTVPMIVFFLPPLFMVVIGPAIIQVMDM